MLQFTAEQLVHLRARAQTDDRILHILQKQADEVRHHFHIPKTGIATWAGYYACPEHSVPLRFNIAAPDRHICPVDGKAYTGDPYTGAWWRKVNDANQRACYQAALRWLLTDDPEDMALTKKILMEYAAYYPGYEAHGGVPYNNPGKANAQTLCDAGWIKGLLLGYDIIRGTLTGEEQASIETNLLRCCCAFLMEQRSDQVHNHEVVVGSAIAMTGLLLDDRRYLDFGLNGKYGLRYQLEHGVLADGFWFEGTPGYHFYAMEQFLLFEQLAWNTPHSFFHDTGFADILKFPLNLVQPDGRLPPLNDVGSGYRGFEGIERVYEHAFSLTGDLDFACLLGYVYQDRERNNLHAFFFGVEELPVVAHRPFVGYHCGEPGGSGITTMHGPDGRFLLIKHGPFGGEHDHYDRLGIHFAAFGKPVIPDLGTCLYGAPLHYGYYKNTLTHNTVCINGENQPPANCTVRRYQSGEGFTLLDAETRWDGSYAPLDSFTICQWSEKAYAGAVIRRIIAWYSDFFIDLFKVVLPEPRTIDWMLHVRGKPLGVMDAAPAPGAWSEGGAGRHIQNVLRLPVPMTAPLKWDLGEDCGLTVLPFPQLGCTCFSASGPDNPATDELSYLIQRVEGAEALFANVVCAYRGGAPPVKDLVWEKAEESVSLRVIRMDGPDIEFGYHL